MTDRAREIAEGLTGQLDFGWPMGCRPFFTYYGGKWRIAKCYGAPRFRSIVEPFAGSAGYSVRHNAPSVRLFDKDPVIASVWEYLIAVSEAEVMSLPLDVESVNDLKVCQEAKWLIGFWLNGGANRPRVTPSAWMRSGRAPSSYWGRVVQRRIAGQLKNIRHWTVTCGDWREAVSSEECTWFVDPPYDGAGRHYSHSEIDYEELADACRRLRGQVIVCENEGASWAPFRPVAISKSSRGYSKESVWYPSADDLVEDRCIHCGQAYGEHKGGGDDNCPQTPFADDHSEPEWLESTYVARVLQEGNGDG